MISANNLNDFEIVDGNKLTPNTWPCMPPIQHLIDIWNMPPIAPPMTPFISFLIIIFCYEVNETPYKNTSIAA